jgi:ribonucleoside-triphosphate reductase
MSLVKGEIENPYQSFISKSRYSKWIPDEMRRETWHETVSRYVTYMSNTEAGRKLGKAFWNDAEVAIENLDVMPSMRGLMTAGPALERENLAQFNCSFISVDDPRAFDEALYILMNGVGLGFSVESQYTSQLPTIPSKMEKVQTIIRPGDSKAGWAKGFRQLIDHLYAGKLPKFDFQDIRLAGARLKTFGGRASGPQPLLDLFQFTVDMFVNAAGRKLTPFECHRIMCKVGEVVVVGGVRRSALISLSDLGDYEMSKAKSGAWWESMPELALANNSAVYNKKPSIGQFLGEWGNLYESKSGERGIFNKESALAGSNSRRDWSKIEGTNPCGEILLRSKGLCNLTEVIVKPEDTVETLKRKVEMATMLGTVQSSLTNFKYLRKAWRDNAEEERLLGVSLTGQFGHTLLNGSEGLDKLADVLDTLRELSVEVNDETAKRIGINASQAITTVKPSGTVSQLTASSSGMHPWYSEFYIRSVRGDNKDPLTQFLIEAGVPNEPDVMKPNATTVFYFPQKAPEGAVTRKDLTAIQHLEVWKVYKQHWTEHNPSITVNLHEEEWINGADWVYDNWDSVGGLSFLPYDSGTYKQAPYQECSEHEYNEFASGMPVIDWDDLSLFEQEDTTTGSQTLNCTSGNCELVSI